MATNKPRRTSLLKPLIVLFSFLTLAAALFFSRGYILERYYGSVAERALQNDMPSRAIEYKLKLQKLKPKDFDLRMELIGLYLDAGNYSRAEYQLLKGIELHKGAPLATLYRKLSSVYVEQDKIADAITLLDNIRDPEAERELLTGRPQPPQLSPPAGSYDGFLEIYPEIPTGFRCFYSLDGTMPSVTNSCGSSFSLNQGHNTVFAVLVDTDGLVSTITKADYTVTGSTQPVSFADITMETIIREALNKPEGVILSGELAALTELKSGLPAQISTLDDLKGCVSLKTLILSGDNADVDISAVSSLKSLTSLTLTDMGIGAGALESLSALSSLTELDLSRNRLASLNGLSELPALQKLTLKENSLTDISAVSSLNALTSLDLSFNTITDITPLAPLTALKELNLTQNMLSSLNGLQNLTRLTNLNLSRNALEEITDLSTLVALATLDISYNSISDITALSAITTLTKLDITGNSVVSLSALSVLSKLKTLAAGDNNIEALTGLEGCAALTSLDVRHNNFQLVKALTGLQNLTELNVENNGITSLKELKSCPQLKTIHAFGNPLTDTVADFEDSGITVYR